MIVTTGGTRTLEVLGSGVGAHRVRGRCLTTIRNEFSVGDTRLATCLAGGRHAGAISIFSGRGPYSGGVVARCAIVSRCNSCSLLSVSLGAKHARRVETRVTRVKRPLLGSNGCNARRNEFHRTLCDCGLVFGVGSTNVLGCLTNHRFATRGYRVLEGFGREGF